ncbi:hypothetical protein EB72_11105 [Mycobacterium sp. SWH-M1]|nr:hypothetical protein EB72_11105 [Mycobacterium sp. SWH-M1]
MLIITDNPAIALRTILRSVMRDDAHIDQSWADYFGANVGTTEFSLRHSEVVVLWRRVHDLLEALPNDEEERNQYLSYMAHYYAAIVSPLPWGNEAGSRIATPIIVDHLSGIASTLKYRAITAPVPSDAALDRLRASIEEWREILNEADFEERFATELRSQVNHLEWLIDNIGTFGSAPVAEQSKKLAGNSVVAMASKPAYAKRIGLATAALVAFVGAVHTGVDETTGVIEGVTEMREAIVRLSTPPKELEPPQSPKELPPGSSAPPESSEPAN